MSAFNKVSMHKCTHTHTHTQETAVLRDTHLGLWADEVWEDRVFAAQVLQVETANSQGELHGAGARARLKLHVDGGTLELC